MSDDMCSFIVLGSSPTPSMEQYDFNNGSICRVEGKEISSQQNSGDFSLLQVDESPKAPNGTSTQNENSLEPIRSAGNNSTSQDNLLSASVMMGSVQSSLSQVFPSLTPSMPENEVKALLQMVTQHGRMKQSIEKANVSMRKTFSVVLKWQEDAKKKFDEQLCTIENQRAAIENAEMENKRLKEALTSAENRACEQEKQKIEEISLLKKQLEDFQKQAVASAEKRAHEQRKQAIDEISLLQKQMEDVQKQAEAERTAAAVEVDELKQLLSEKHSIVQNLAKEIENLQLEKQEFVVVKSNKPDDTVDSIDVNFIAKEEHDHKIKTLQRELSVVVATNLEFADMKQVYIDELNCLKVNLSSAEELLAKNRVEMQRQAKDIETKDVSLAENIRELKSLSEQVDVLTAQLDIYKNDFEAERAARAQLASEKDRALNDLKLLQKRNQQLIEEVQNGRSEQEEVRRAANESLDKRDTPEKVATSSGDSSAGTSNEEQRYERHVLYCPLCNGGFKDLTTLQNHVEDCVGVE